MRLSLEVLEIPLRHVFTISRSSKAVTRSVLLEIEHEGERGLGETTPSGYYGQSAASVLAALESLRPWLEAQDPWNRRIILAEARRRLGGDDQALCALDLALHDWAARRLGVPVHRLFGLPAGPLPATSYTLGIDEIPAMIAKMREFADFPIFKIKLGRPNDLEIVRALRAETAAVFRVDANCAWEPDEAIEKSHALKKLGVEFIEQPLPPERLEEMPRVFERSALPLIADENAVGPADPARLPGRFHGINVKLVKCGGLDPALRMIGLARDLGLKVMLGCMVETSCCCTAAAHLGALADYLDLDGPLLVDPASDPCSGMTIERGVITLPGGPGLGVERR